MYHIQGIEKRQSHIRITIIRRRIQTCPAITHIIRRAIVKQTAVDSVSPLSDAKIYVRKLSVTWEDEVALVVEGPAFDGSVPFVYYGLGKGAVGSAWEVLVTEV